MMFVRKIYRPDMIDCVLCHDAPCVKACEKTDPAGMLHSIWFDNEKVVAARLPEQNPCAECSAPCENACVRSGQVSIRRLISMLYDEVKPELDTDLPENENRLQTDICGIPLENPFLLSSSVVASTYDMCARAFEAGWAGVAFKTICSFDIHEASPRFSAITGDNGRIIGVNPHTYVSSPSVHGKSVVGGYSGNAVKPIALRFIAELGQNPRLQGMHISGMGGVETWEDALEFILLGADSIQVTTAVMQYGYRIIDDLKAGLNYYLTEKGFGNVKDAVGLALDSVSATTDVLERDTVIFPKFDRSKCIGCGRCVISCADGGHQALRLSDDRKPILDGRKCVGCHLCILVCPQRAIRSSQRRISKKSD